MTQEQQDRDDYVLRWRRLRLQRDRHDTETEADERWAMRAQVRFAVAAYRAGRAPHPGDLSSHRRRHSDAARRERAAA